VSKRSATVNDWIRQRYFFWDIGYVMGGFASLFC